MSLEVQNKTILITGATSGIGLATAAELSRLGACVLGVGRSEARCREAEETIRKVKDGCKATYFTADLSSLKQVRKLAESVRNYIEQERNGHLDALINNAGTFSSWYVTTAEGFELQFAVNHLAPFLLTHELLPLIKKAPDGRVITVSSGSHYHTRIRWKDIQMRKHYNGLFAYKQSKLANVLFTAELNRRLGPGSTVHAFAADPGLVNTEIGLKGTHGIARWIWRKRRKSGVEPGEAAMGIVYLAGEPSIQNSSSIYWKECRPKEPSAYAMRKDEAARLWEISGSMCGIRPEEYGIRK